MAKPPKPTGIDGVITRSKKAKSRLNGHKYAQERGARDGTPGKRYEIFPTERELAVCERLAQKYGFRSKAEMFTEAINIIAENGWARITLDMDMEFAAKLEYIAKKSGYDSAEDWIMASLKQTVEDKYEEVVYLWD